MTKQVQIRRGTFADNMAFTGAEGELTMSTDTSTLHLHNGVVAGGTVFNASAGGSTNPYNVGDGYTLPLAGDFAISASSSFSVADITQNGSGVSFNGTNSSFSWACAEQVVNYEGDFQVTGYLQLASLNYGNWGMGINIKDSNGKRIMWGFRNTQTWRTRFPNLDSYDNLDGFGGDGQVCYYPTLYRIRRVGSTFHYDVSFDGMNFDTFLSESSTEYLGNTITGVGLIVAPNNMHVRLACYSFRHGAM